MIEQDTIKLLRECDAGIKMGIASIDDVLEHTQSDSLHQILSTCKDEHEQLQHQVQALLGDYHDKGKAPNPIASGMSWVKTKVKLDIKESDDTIAGLMTDGCNMGVKSLNRYLNQYPAADEKSKDLTKSIIQLESDLIQKLQPYL